MFDALLAYAHFLAFGLLVGCLVLEWRHLRADAGAQEWRALGRIDLAYFAAALLMLATGLARLFWGAKGAGFYLANPAFHAKLGLFLLIGLLSIPPTLRFLRWSRRAKSDPAWQPPAPQRAGARRLVGAELALLGLLPLLAALMARGLGH
jgi:putative membrane protein